MINIRGFIETSLLDWDGKVTSVVFLPYCNFKCPFCDNGILVENPESLPEVKIETVEAFIRERKDFIDGVVITGGEPTIHLWLPEIVKRFKDLGVLVKLDTNGTNPVMLSELLGQKLIDYVAMDLKAPLNDQYHIAAGIKFDLDQIRESIKLLMGSDIDYEFRTTVLPSLLTRKDLLSIGRWLQGSKKYYLQQFHPTKTLNPAYLQEKAYDLTKLGSVCNILRVFFDQCEIRE